MFVCHLDFGTFLSFLKISINKCLKVYKAMLYQYSYLFCIFMQILSVFFTVKKKYVSFINRSSKRQVYLYIELSIMFVQCSLRGYKSE